MKSQVKNRLFFVARPRLSYTTIPFLFFLPPIPFPRLYSENRKTLNPIKNFLPIGAAAAIHQYRIQKILSDLVANKSLLHLTVDFAYFNLATQAAISVFEITIVISSEVYQLDAYIRVKKFPQIVCSKLQIPTEEKSEEYILSILSKSLSKTIRKMLFYIRLILSPFPPLPLLVIVKSDTYSELDRFSGIPQTEISLQYLVDSIRKGKRYVRKFSSARFSRDKTLFRIRVECLYGVCVCMCVYMCLRVYGIAACRMRNSN